MKAVVFHGVGDVRLEEVEEPCLEDPNDAIVRLTTSAICGTDLHMVRGTIGGMEPGTILGHEGVGVVEEVAHGVRNLVPGDRVVVCSTVACGYCSYCRAGHHAQCDNGNPNGPATAFLGGPTQSGGFNGLQAEYACVPFANVGCVKLSEDVSDDQAILVSDIFPTGWFAAEGAGVAPGDTVAVFGCGPVGQFAIASALLMGAGRVFAVDAIPSRLELARSQGAETIDFEEDDPVDVLLELTGGIGPDRAIDAVGVDAVRPATGPAADQGSERERRFDEELERIAPDGVPAGELWQPGNAPSQALEWAVQSLAKAGTLMVVGVYPPAAERFPIGTAFGKNLTLAMGNCNHRRYVPRLIELVRSGAVDPLAVLTQHAPLPSAIDAYREFDRREPGWTKVALVPAAGGTDGD